ncbi:MAG: dockerin type I repeat-containing protein [Ruminococcus sp.]|nr:dockerin type I repeat-containing protein [Ruminococcus sp.]
MRKLKKVMTAIVSGLAALSMLISSTGVVLPVGALWDYRYASSVTDLCTPPEGYESFEDSELYQNHEWLFEYGALNYRSIEHRQFFASYYYFAFSMVDLTITNDGWETIYNKYSEALDMDHATLLALGKTVRIMDSINVSSCDYEDVDAEILKRYNSIEEKYDTLMAMCSEMYEAGCIESAEYTPFSAIAKPLIADGLCVYDYAGTQEEMELFVTSICPEAAVKKVSCYISDELHSGYRVDFAYEGATAEDFFAVLDAVSELEGEHIIDANIYVADEKGYDIPVLGEGPIDILAELEKPATTHGDLNQDGKVTVLDAITLSKANIQAITLNESQTAAADCNGDGLIDSADVTVLLYYLTDKVDVLPVTIE